MRVLHLLDLRCAADEPLLACRAALTLPGVTHRVVGLGARAASERTRRAGIALDSTIPFVGPWPELSFRRLRRLLADRNGPGASRPWADLVQCWSPSLLGLARLASGERTPPRLGALLRPPLIDLSTARTAHWHRLSFGLHYAHLFALDRFTRSAWATCASRRRGGRLLEQNIRLLDCPAPPLPSARTPERASVREQLGIDEGETVVLLLADPPGAGDVSRLAFLLGLLFTTGIRAVGLTRAGGLHQHRAARFVRLHGRRWGLLTSDLPLPLLLAACDVAVWDAGEPGLREIPSAGAASLTAAIAASVPVVAGRHPISVETLAHLGGGMITRDASVSALADGVISIAALAADGAERLPAPRPPLPNRFTADLLHLWQESTNTPVVRAGLPTPLALLRPPHPVHPVRTAFTLIEMLLLVAVLGLLIGLLIPALGSSRARARAIDCAARLQQLGIAANLYLTDFSGALPQVLRPTPDGPRLSPLLFGGKRGALHADGLDELGAAERPLNRYLSATVGSPVPSTPEADDFRSPADQGGDLPGTGIVPSMFDAVGTSYTLNDRLLRASPSDHIISTLIPITGGPMPPVATPDRTWLIGSHPIHNRDLGLDHRFLWYGKAVRANLLMVDMHAAALRPIPAQAVQTTADYTFKPAPIWPAP